MGNFTKRLFWRKRGTGWIPNEKDTRDIRYHTIRDMSELPSVASLEAWDEITDQKGTSSCVGHAVAGSICIAENRSGKNYGHPSRLFVYWIARARHKRPPLRDDGAYIRSAFKAVQKLGVPDEEHWPFRSKSVNRQPGPNTWQRADPRKDGEYLRITGTGDTLIRRIMSAIDDGYAVTFGTQLAKSFMSASGDHVINHPEGDEELAGGHAMRIIGYRTRPGGAVQFRVSNSWGPRWRDGGRCWFTERYITWVKTRDFTIVRGWKRLRGEA